MLSLIVLALYVLHQALGYRAAIAEIALVTKPGGIFAFIDPLLPVRLVQRCGVPVWTYVVTRRARDRRAS